MTLKETFNNHKKLIIFILFLLILLISIGIYLKLSNNKSRCTEGPDFKHVDSKVKDISLPISKEKQGTIQPLSDYECLDFKDTPNINPDTQNVEGYYRTRRYNINTVFTTNPENDNNDPNAYTIGFKDKFIGVNQRDLPNVDTKIIKENCLNRDANGYMISYVRISNYFSPVYDKINLKKLDLKLLLDNIIIDPETNIHGNYVQYDLFIGAWDDTNCYWDLLTPFTKDNKTLSPGDDNTPFNRRAVNYNSWIRRAYPKESIPGYEEKYVSTFTPKSSMQPAHAWTSYKNMKNSKCCLVLRVAALIPHPETTLNILFNELPEIEREDVSGDGVKVQDY